MSGIKYLLNGLHTYPVTDEAKNTETNTIKHILYNYEYDTNIIENYPRRKYENKTYTLTHKAKNWMGYIHI
jgi:hypothetical protein